jgi:peptide/nickel transport system ATP-binding protein
MKWTVDIAAQSHTLVRAGSFDVADTGLTFLFGESGIGKSLLAKAIFGLLEPDSLTVHIDGRPYDEYMDRPDTRAHRRRGFFVFQEPSTHLNPLMTLDAQLMEGSLAGTDSREGILRQLWDDPPAGRLDALLSVYPKPYRPSGGEKQRMLVAMAFMKIDMLQDDGAPPPLFVFDEPTGSLDNATRDVVISMLADRLRRKRLSVLFITHDYSIISVIQRNNSQILPLVHFKEVHREADGLRVRAFSPEEYTGWVRRQHPARASRGEELLLDVESGVEVYGSRLAIASAQKGAGESGLRVYAGTMVYVKAPSGTGKTTLVKCMMGLVRPQRLRMRLDGMLFSETTPYREWHHTVWGRTMTMAFQHADEALNPHSTVRETFEGLPGRRVTSEAALRTLLGELFDEASQEGFLDRKVAVLSGGQKQRLNLLRCLSLNTRITILDEPLNGLDFESAVKVLEMLRTRMAAGQSFLVISHNDEIFDALVAPEDVYLLRSVPGVPRRG